MFIHPTNPVSGSIINAVFFEGKWEHPFEGEDTEADGAAMELPDVIEFIANRPFVYAIRDTNTGIILFLGQVVSVVSQ